MPRKGGYLGGSTIIKDAAYRARLASKLRKTEKAQQAQAKERERFEAEMRSYRPEMHLIKGKRRDDDDSESGR